MRFRRCTIALSTFVTAVSVSALVACGEPTEDADASQGAIGVEVTAKDQERAAKERASEKAAKEDAANREAMAKFALHFPSDTLLATSPSTGLVASRVVYTGATPRAVCSATHPVTAQSSQYKIVAGSVYTMESYDVPPRGAMRTTTIHLLDRTNTTKPEQTQLTIACTGSSNLLVVDYVEAMSRSPNLEVIERPR